MSQVQIKSMSPKHEAIIDWLLEHPGAKNMNELCAKLCISRTWLSVVMRSDVFREEWTRRRQDHSSELTKQLIEKQLAVTLKALDRVDEFLDDRDEVDIQSALDVADKTAKQVGIHRNPGFGPVLEERTREFRTVDSGTLREARETIRRVTHVAVATD